MEDIENVSAALETLPGMVGKRALSTEISAIP